MSQTDVFGYVETPLYQAVELPYQESSLALVLVLPNAQVPWDDFQSSLKSSRTLAALAEMKPTRVRVRVPKFRIATTLALKELLEPKMPEAFSEEADFSGMSGKGKLKISTVVHMAYITVDEQGTEAGAATAAAITLKAPPDAHFIANRPFHFLLHHRPTRTPLFVGHVKMPEE
jgi:serpin B